MTGKVLSMTSGKGGVGKTTATANIAVALAAMGERVVCIDGDIGLRNLDVVMGLENRIVYDLVDVVEGRARLRQAMIKDKRLPELNLIPAAQTRSDTPARTRSPASPPPARGARHPSCCTPASARARRRG